MSFVLLACMMLYAYAYNILPHLVFIQLTPVIKLEIPYTVTRSPMIILPRLLFAVLVVGPPAADYSDANTRVEAAIQLANRDADAGVAELETAIATLADYGPELEEDRVGRDNLTLGRLALARAYFVTDHQPAAERVLDETIRKSQDQEVPAAMFGPSFEKLYLERVERLDEGGKGNIKVNCLVSCRIVIEGRPQATLDTPFYLGSYRIWISATDADSDIADLIEVVELTEDGQVEVVEFGEPPGPALPPGEQLQPQPFSRDPSTSQDRERIMPRWSEILLIGGGVALVGAASAVFALDGRCHGYDPAYENDCPEYHEYTVLGASLAAIGGLTMIAGGTTLGLDETNARKSRRELSVFFSWGGQF